VNPDGERMSAPVRPQDGMAPPSEMAAAMDGPITREASEELEERMGLLQDKRKLALLILLFAVLIGAVYVLLPQIIGLEGTLNKIGSATWYWVVVAVGFNVAAFGAYVMLFRGILGGTEGEIRDKLDTRASYQITMASLAATRLFSAAGAGGLVLTYWALRKAGMERRRSACRMVALLVLLYTAYLLALIVFGILLRVGVLHGDNPVGGTIVPAAVAGVVLVLGMLTAFLPQDVDKRLAAIAKRPRGARIVRKLGAVPATVASGVRTAIAYIRHPERGALAVMGAVGFWAANIGVLWASFEAVGGDVPFGVLVQGFFVGMAANLIPSPAGGAGPVDAGMIGAFALFGIEGDVVFPAVLLYRLIAFWLPIPPGIVAWFQLRRTVTNWEQVDRTPYTSQSKVTAEA
jgi:putative heme transporter